MSECVRAYEVLRQIRVAVRDRRETAILLDTVARILHGAGKFPLVRLRCGRVEIQLGEAAHAELRELALVYDGRDFGVLWVGLPGVLDEALLIEAAADLAFGLGILRDRESLAFSREGLLQQIGAMAQVGGWEFDVATGEGRWTDEIKRIHDLPTEVVPNIRMALSFFHGKWREMIRKTIPAVLKRGESYDLEVILTSATGREKWVRIAGFPVWHDGKIVQSHGIMQDISQRKKAEQELILERSRLRTLLDTLPDPVWVKDAQGAYLDCNVRFEALIGSKRAEILGRTDYDYFPRELADHFRRYDLMAVERGSSGANEEWVTYADGHRELLETLKTPVVYGAGGPVAVLGIGRDITERKQAVEALSLSEERFRRALDLLPLPMSLTNTSGVTVYLNSAFIRFFGCTLEELPTRPLLRQRVILDPSVRRSIEMRFDEEIQILGQTGSPTPAMECMTIAGDGSSRLVELMASQMGDLRALVYRDITETRRIEEHLRSAQRMEAVGRLAGGVAHDFNNLLTVILACANLALDELGPHDAIRQELEEILIATGRGESLTRQLLLFSRRQVMEMGPLDLYRLVEGLRSMLRRLIGENIELSFRCAADLPPFRGDAGQIEQLVVNLALNARDAMPEGGKLEVVGRLAALDAADAKLLDLAGGEYVELGVSDNGAGMDPATLNRAFEPFFSTKGVGKGTGLGLATVYGIVKECGGSIRVETAVGAGTRISVFFPLCDPTA